MRKLSIAFAAGLLAIAGLSGCSEKIEVAAPYKDYTVVAGLLDMDDTAHYIRIQKAFLDGSKSAVDMAKEVDSNFYAQIDVKIKVLSSGSLIDTITPVRVDLNSEGYSKEDGTFFTSPNYAYKFTDALNPAYRYRLVITHANGDVDSAETAIINTDPAIFDVARFSDSAYKLDFKDTSASRQFSLGGRVPPAAIEGVIEGIIRVRWTEDGSPVQHSADWRFASVTVPSNSSGFNLVSKNVEFFAFLHSALGIAPAGKARRMGLSDVIIYAGTKDLIQYQIITQAQSVGLTSSEIKPSFTNIKGKNVLGLFTSRGKRVASARDFTNETKLVFTTYPGLADVNIEY